MIIFRFQKGFSLLELLIVFILIGLLSALSIPIYSHYFIQQRRLEATVTLSQLALALENYYTEHNSYQGATLSTLHFSEWIADHHYQLTIVAATDNHFLIQAKPFAEQAEKDTVCGTLMLNTEGEKMITGSGSIETCW